MLVKTEGIVLSRIKFNDKSIICNIFTKDYGKLSFLVYISNSKTTKNKINLLQPFNILSIEMKYKESANFQKITEMSLLNSYKSIPFSLVKGSIVMFLSEFINKTLKDCEPDEEMYLFLVRAAHYLDLHNEHINNFHIILSFKLLKFLGIQPENNYSESRKIFDLQCGKFIIGRPQHNDFADEKMSENIKLLLATDIENSHTIRIDKNVINSILELIIKYCNIHIERPGKIKSLEILQQVFS